MVVSFARYFPACLGGISLLNGFKQFIRRGNVVDMAVGVVDGGAFAAVVAALTKDLLTPLIAALVRQTRLFGDQIYVERECFCSW